MCFVYDFLIFIYKKKIYISYIYYILYIKLHNIIIYVQYIYIYNIIITLCLKKQVVLQHITSEIDVCMFTTFEQIVFKEANKTPCESSS